MTLPSSGAMSTADINAELNRSTSASLNLNDSELLALAGKAAGQPIQIPQDLYGKGYARGWVDTTRTITVGYDADSTTSYGGNPIPGYGYINSPACGSISSRNVGDTSGGTANVRVVGSRYNWLTNRYEIVSIDPDGGPFAPDKVGVTFVLGAAAFYIVADRRLSSFGYQYMAENNTHATNLASWINARVGQSGTVRFRDPV